MHATARGARQCRVLPAVSCDGAGRVDLNCTRPAAVAARTRTGWYLAPAVFRALANAAPTTVQSPTGLPSR